MERTRRSMSILVRATNWVGDAVMSLPALRASAGEISRGQDLDSGQAWVADLYAASRSAMR